MSCNSEAIDLCSSPESASDSLDRSSTEVGEKAGGSTVVISEENRVTKRAKTGEADNEDDNDVLEVYEERLPTRRVKAAASCEILEVEGRPNPPFQLLPVPGLASFARRAPYLKSLQELVAGPIEIAIVSNYMMTAPLVFNAFPGLLSAKEIVLLHGERNRDDVEGMRHLPISVFKPRLEPYGTHHTKLFILFYKAGIRVIVHTANLISCDIFNKAQGAWHQDFPLKRNASDSHSSEFEDDLKRYLAALRLPLENKRVNGTIAHIDLLNKISEYDFTSARAKLIASVPGRHTQANKLLYGHMAVREVLRKENFSDSFAATPPSSLALQFTSLGSLNDKLLNDILTSFSAGIKLPQTSLLAPAKLACSGIVWPTTTEVMESTEGLRAGNSIPGYKKNVDKMMGLQAQVPLYRFRGRSTPQKAAMPHIKTFTRYSETGRIAWCIVGSHNLSGAAWGVLQKDNSQLYIRSFELSVMMLPSLELKYLNQRHVFDAPSGSYKERGTTRQWDSVEFYHLANATKETGEVYSTTSNTTKTAETKNTTKVVYLPLPYEIPTPATRYRKGIDTPWYVEWPMLGGGAVVGCSSSSSSSSKP